ncbi:MAG: hypothetical protein ACRC1T_04785 [Clostridium chrysemydis]|uniref:hypothetical protein n=1 Tax=Clostridium chrysemydis TaxID=2665504 RepID=UPI003F2B1C2C
MKYIRVNEENINDVYKTLAKKGYKWSASNFPVICEDSKIIIDNHDIGIIDSENKLICWDWDLYKYNGLENEISIKDL